MIDLSKLDPGLLYELEQQLREVVDIDTYVSISFDSEENLFCLHFYGNKPEWHAECAGYDKTLVGAARKCGEDLAAAEEKMEAGNGA